MMLFYTKAKKFGMITIMGIIVGIYLWITGMGIYPAIFGVVFGLLADLIAKSGKHQSVAKTILSHGVFCVMLYGNFLLCIYKPILSECFLSGKPHQKKR